MAVSTPSASPTRPAAENRMLVLTSMATPTSAAARPARKTPVGFWRRNIQAASVTKIEARLASSVEFATEVSLIEVCQKARSPAKATPAAKRRKCLRGKVRVEGAVRERINNHRAGTASATRQKAVAVGPASESRTKIGESAMHAAPRSNAPSALFMAHGSGALGRALPE